MAAAAATTLPYSVPANYAIRLVEEPLSAHSHIDDHPVQPRASDPSHFQFPRTSLHAVTLHSHFKGPHAPGSVRASPRTATTWVPPTDIRETLANYHIEMEVAGVTDKEDILIQWLTPHTLLVQGTASRPRNIGLVDQGEGKRVWEGKESEGWATETGRAKQPEPEDGGPLVRTTSRETVEAELLADTTPTILLAERKVGPWRRTFTLPDDVEMRELKARLEGGLLRIDMPKRSIEDLEALKGAGIRIEID